MSVCSFYPIGPGAAVGHAAAMVFELKRAEIELAGWIENPDIPPGTAREMLDRLQSIRLILKSVNARG